MSNSPADVCPLCTAQESLPYFTDRQRCYQQCSVCALVYVPAQFHLSQLQQRLRYDEHNNSPADEGYRTFLGQLMAPLLNELQPGQQGLDFGCGPGPTLSVMLQEHGYVMSLYDPFYANDDAIFQHQYDFITCTEAIEHFEQPGKEWRRLLSLLKDGGLLAIMTGLYPAKPAFADWYYKNDPTHICFYSARTFEWLAQRDGLELVFSEQSVVIFRNG